MGYDGFLTMERQNTDMPENDSRKGLNYLKRYL